jgi:hypothetical protein
MTQPKKNLVLALTVIACLIASGPRLYADTTIWGTNARFGNVDIEAFNITTAGVVTQAAQFLDPNLTARSDNGRGIALLGDTIYYTTATSGNIYITNATTHADMGILVNTGFAGIANVATDGTFIYANNYQDSSGIINKYNTAGTLVGTVTVGVGFNGRDGFEVQNNPNINGGALTFISNRGDAQGPYDVYNASGTLIISAFIDPSVQGIFDPTGIAYDGTNYYVSSVHGNKLLQYSGTGAFIRTLDLSGLPEPNGARLLEDLSAVGNTVSNPGPGTGVPEPSTLSMFGIGMTMLAAGWLRRRTKLN